MTDKRNPPLTPREVGEMFEYDPNSGVVTRLSTGGVGTIAARGYRTFCVRRRHYYAHRLAWAMMTGRWPKNWVDHANCDKSDNRWVNLRAADARQNAGNSRAKGGVSGLKGVTAAKYGRWRAVIHRRSLGQFATKEDAHAAYVEAAKEAYGAFARGA